MEFIGGVIQLPELRTQREIDYETSTSRAVR